MTANTYLNRSYRGDPQHINTSNFSIFIDAMNTGDPKKILEVGVAQSIPGRSTHHKSEFSNYSEYIKSDFIDDNADVDIVADIHCLENTFEQNYFDGIVARSVYEHVKKPWIASASLNKVLKVGGLVHIDTHFTFPLHGYPEDYYRFTTDGLVSLFDDEFGFKNVACGFAMPCSISFASNQSKPAVWNQHAGDNANFLHVAIVAEKVRDL